MIDQWTGASATALRRAMRLTHEAFADKLGISVRASAKWRAQPDIKPSPLLQQVLDTVFGQLDDPTRQRFSMFVEPPIRVPSTPAEAATADLLVDPGEAVQYTNVPDGTVDVVARLWSADLGDARAVLTSPIVGNAWSDAALSWLVQSPKPTSAQKPIAVGEADLAAVRSTVSMFSQLDGAFGGAHARRALIEFLHSDVLPLLDEKHSDGVKSALQEVAAEATLLAAWMAYDAGLHGLAQRYFVQALRLADAAGARLLGASILDAMSHQATFLGHTHEAVNLARAARAGAASTATPSLEAHFHAMEARALAAEGDSSAADKALSASVRVFERREAGTDPDWFGYFDDAELSAEFSHCFRDLGRSQDAVTYAERGLSGVSPRSDFFVSMVKAAGHLGTPGRGDAEPDAACAAALAALDIGGNMKSARCVQYARDFRRKLAPYAGARVVREFVEAGAQHAIWRMTEPAAADANR